MVLKTDTGITPEAVVASAQGEPARPLDAHYRSVTTATSLIIGLTACIVIIGWIVGNEYLKRVLPGMVAMNPLTAVTFFACAMTLVMIHRDQKHLTLRRGVVGAGALIALVGFVKLCDIAFGTSLGFDQVLFRGQLDVAGQAPNRMAPNTALCFLLSGTSLALLTSGRTALLTAAQGIAVLVVLLSLVAIVGYSYGVAPFYGVGTFIPMALHTATNFLFLAAGILFARPHRALMSIVTSETAGGASARLLLPAAILIPIVMGWLPLAGQRAGLLELEVGVALFVVGNVLVLVALIWWNATLLHSTDLKRQAVERELVHSATHDGLTGLANRARFREELDRAVARSQRYGTTMTVLYLDLDGFKAVNDTLGHGAGDELLKQVSRRILACLRTVDVCARLGGDEFTVLTEEIPESGAITVAERIVAEVGGDYELAGRPARIGVSIGIAVAQGRSARADDLLKRADTSLYEAKRTGKGRVCVAPPGR